VSAINGHQIAAPILTGGTGIHVKLETGGGIDQDKSFLRIDLVFLHGGTREPEKGGSTAF